MTSFPFPKILWKFTTTLMVLIPTIVAPPMFIFPTVGPSMGPTIGEYTVNYYEEEPEYHVGDVVIYKSGNGEGYIVHRIVNKTSEGYILKGDIYNKTDMELFELDPITKDQIIGEVKYAFSPSKGLVDVTETERPE